MEKKRLTLTGNKMPEDVYKKLEELGNQRKLTPYVVNLIEKEETMDRLIEHLSVLANKIDNVEHILSDLNLKPEMVAPASEDNLAKKSATEIIKEGKLEISERIEGGIEEDVEEVDF